MATLLTLVGLLCLCGLSLSNGCKRELLVNVDFPGQDITRLFSPDTEHCQQLCTQHSSCRFFSFIRPDSTRTGQFFCHLKGSHTGQPKVQKHVVGITSGFSLKSCHPDPLPCLSHVYHDVDFYGADFRSLFTADYKECQRACTSDPTCQFFTFLTHTYPASKYRYKCHLKFSSTVPGSPVIVRTRPVVSGFSHSIGDISKKCNTACEGKLFPNTDITMHTINVPLAASPEHCQALCSAHPLCTSFTYVSADFKCHMKGSTQELITRPRKGFTSGLPARFCHLNNKWLKKIYAGIDFPHNDIRHFQSHNLWTCLKTCTADPNCQFFSFVTNKSPARRLCYLKRVITMPAPPRITKLANAVSGFSLKNCH